MKRKRVDNSRIGSGFFGAGILVSLCFAVLGCQSGKPAAKSAFPQPSPTPPCESKTYFSAGGRTITRWVYGTGERTILVLAGIRGDEQGGYDLARALGGYLKNNPQELNNRRVVILPELNPDGIRAKTAYNSNNKDINRDFKRKSQPETIALLNMLRCYDPEWIIALRDFGQIDFDPSPRSSAKEVRRVGQLAQAIALEIGAKAPSLAVKRMFSGRDPAEDSTLGLYSGNVLRIPVVSIGLHGYANDMSARALWQRYKEPILAGIQFNLSTEGIRRPIVLPSPSPSKSVPVPSERGKSDGAADPIAPEIRTRAEASLPEENSPAEIPAVSDSPLEKSPADDPPPVRDPFEPDLERAISLFESGRYPEARGAFEAFSDCEACPRWIEESVAAEGAVESARSAESDRNWRGLLAASRDLLKHNAQDPRAKQWREVAVDGLLGLFRNDFEAGRYGAAAENFDSLENWAECPECETLAGQARNALEMRREGETAMDEGRLSEAEVFFQSVLSINPADETARAKLAVIEGRRQTDGRVAELLEGGKALCGAGNWRDGIPALEMALDLNSDCGGCRAALETCLDARDEHFYQAGLTKFQGEDTAGAITDWARVRAGYKVVDGLLSRACQLLAGKGEEHPACGS